MPVSFAAEAKNWPDFHRRLREQVSIESVLALLGVSLPHEGRGRGYHVLCPIHHETKPSMHVYLDQNRVHCFGACDEGYGPVGLYAAARLMEFVEAADELGKLFGISPEDGVGVQSFKFALPKLCTQFPVIGEFPLPMSSARALFYNRQLKSFHYEWLEEKRLLPRSLVDEVRIGHTPLRDFPIGYSIPVWSDLDSLITIRFRRDDLLLEQRQADLSPGQIQWMNDRKYWGIRGRNDVYLFGTWALPGTGELVILAESEFDTLALIAGGLPALTLTMGASEKRWPGWTRFLDPFERWLVVFDDDEAGRKAAAGMRVRWPHRVALFPWPDRPWGPKDGGGDVTDFLLKFGIEDFRQRMELALAGEPSRTVPISAVGRRLWNGFDEMGSVAWRC